MSNEGDEEVRVSDRPRRAAAHGILRCRSRGPSVDRSALLAVSLALVMVLSVVAVSTAGAVGGSTRTSTLSADGDAAVVGSAAPPGGNGNGGGGNAGGSSNGGGSTSGDGGSSSSDDDPERGSDSNRASNGRSNGAGESGSNGGANGPPNRAGEPGSNGPPNGNTGGASGGNAGAGGPPSERPAGNGPTVDVSVGRPDAPGRSDAAAGSAGGADGERRPSVVNVAVRGAEAGQSVSVDTSPPAVEREAVAFDGVSATVKRSGDFTLEITSSRERLPGSPEFDTDDGAEALGRIRLEHSITNEEVEDVSFDFRVSKSRLRAADTDPENVALYRHAEGSWSALPTDIVGETGTHYLLRAASPGMSEFAVGAMQPSFDTWWADVGDESVDAGEQTRISARVSNVGGADGVYEATLEVDGDVVDRRRVTVAAGGTRQVNFQRRFERPGTYEVTVDGVTAGEVDVDDEPAEASSSDRRLAIGLEMVLDLGRAVATPVSPSPGF